MSKTDVRFGGFGMPLVVGFCGGTLLSIAVNLGRIATTLEKILEAMQ